MSPRFMSTLSADSILGAATTPAREALLEVTGESTIGDHLGISADGERFVSHLFACTKLGYVGWYWAVSVTRAPDSETVTINDVVLLPGDGAIVAPVWTPYRERIQPGDLSPGDVLPPDENDPRLVEAWSAGDDDDNPADRAVAKDVGLGRTEVLSIEGRDQAAQRWYDGEQGPNAPIAQQAPGTCRTCGFMVRMAGPLSLMFGACANAMANDDGRVVAFTHGCGAHSGAKLDKSAAPQQLPPPAHDTVTIDTMVMNEADPSADPF
ncbi:MAG TPA: DUF3027 domain-containing protein [Aeromicrobium sp.]|nr:DUF3027 domain-containing protein [Aeromicrobium sp.]